MKRFELGQTVITKGAELVFTRLNLRVFPYLWRHISGDWGDLCSEDKQLNEEGLKHEGRLFSAYELPDGTKIYIITERDRSVTTILLPEEY